jgi:REP element-mobilizing transposase RayT
MTTGCKIENQASAYFLTFTVVDWVDVFSRQVYRDIILESLTYCRKEKGLKVWGYVIMTNHIHCILSAVNNNLSDVVRDFKRFTATSIMKLVPDKKESRSDWMMRRFEFAIKRGKRNERFQFWQHDNHPVELHSLKFINQKLNYIHMNPVRAGWVEKESDWLYSSMRNYCHLPVLMEIDLLDI